MTDKILAVLWLLMLIAFMGVVTTFVNEPALWIIVVVCLLMAAYDFFVLTRDSANNSKAK